MAKPRKEYIYGINPVFEVVRSGRRSILCAFLNKAATSNSRLKKLVAYLESKEIPIEWVDKGRLVDLSESKEHQGVVLKSSTYPYVAFDSLLDTNKLLLLDNIEDPHNVGAILRSADIFGFDSVLLSKKGVPDIYPSVVKVSAGATEFLHITKEMSGNSYVRKTIEHGYQLLVLDAKGKVDIAEMRTSKIDKLLLVVGGEDKAVGQFIINNANYVVRIDQCGRINSLNASVAAGIAMFVVSQLVKD